jgi:hypothetical protein
MGIKSDPALMIESPFYEGHPINLSDYVEEEQYNKIVSLFFQNYITFEGFKGLYNYFNEAEIEIIIKSLEKNFAKDADTGPYFNDRNSGFDLLTMINSSEYEKIREIFVNNNKKGFNQNDLIYQEWLKVLTEEEKKDSKLLGYVNYFSMVFPFAKAREILDQFKTLQLLSERLSQINVNNGYYWRTDDVALIGAMIVFDAFNNPDNINKIFEVYQEIGITKFKILFTGITERLSPSFLEDIRNNYKAITENTGYLNEHNFEAFLKPKYESFEEMIEDYNNYKCVHNNIAPVVYKMKQKGASEEYCRYYSQLYEKAIKRPGLAIPYVSYHGEYFSFEAAKLWDSTLVGFDIENNINMPPEAKDNLLTNNNCRLIEVKDKQGLVIDQIYVQINSENKVVLSSLMEIRNTQIKMQIYNKIIEEMTKQFLQAGITATFEITQGLNELVSGSDSSTIFGEKPREITLPSGEYINDKPEYNLDFIKITSIGQIAFWGAGNHDYTNEIRNTNGESTTFYVGRDWFIKTDRNAKSQTLNKQGIPVEFKKPNTYIDFMARYSSDRSSIGQQELSDCIVDMVTNSDDTFLVGSHPTSYYTFAKLAAEGKIFVISDYKLVTEGEGLMSSMNITDVIVDNEQGYDFTAINRSFSVSFIPLLRGKGVVGNEITFISPRNLSETQKQRMAEQIKYYSGLVKYLEEARRKEKSPENNFWFHGYGSQEEIYEQLEKELPDIKNLRIYSIGYLKNILEKRSACDFATYTTSPKPYYSSTK